MFILSGSSNLPLAQKIANQLKAPLADIDISKFPNGEKRIWVKENLKDQAVAIIQSFSDPVDEHIIELALIADACHHLGAKLIIAVVPWLGYSPQDKEFRKGEPISIHVVAKIIEAMSINHLITVDIHSESSLEYFHIPTSYLSALPIFIDHFKHQDLDHHAIVSLDKGAYPGAKSMAAALNLPLVSFTKHRDPHNGQVTFSRVEGEVKGFRLISIDDFVSTGSTRIQASTLLKSQGALSYTDCITHALLAGDSPKKLQLSSIDTLYSTDTYLVPADKQFPKLKILSVAPLLAMAIQNLKF